MANVVARVKQIVVYPVKSCAGVSLREARIGDRGIEHDREWMLVSALDGQFVTQRDYPKLALVQPTISRDSLILNAPGMSPLGVSLAFSDRDIRAHVSVWRDQFLAVHCHADASAWFSRFLQVSNLELVRADPQAVRSSRSGAYPARIAFADAFPFLCISQASLDDLNARVFADLRPLFMNSFRPNIVFEGCDAFAEDTMGHVRIGRSVHLWGVESCARCNIVNVDQATGQSSRQPLATLASYRTFPNHAGKSKVMFGEYFVHHGTGVIRVGDEVVQM